MISTKMTIYFIRCLHLQNQICLLTIMKIALANKKLDEIIAKVDQKGLESSGLIDDLKELRGFALKEQDPLVTKVLRLTYEFLQENDCFDVQAQFEEDDEGNEYPIEIEDKENLLYLLNLLRSRKWSMTVFVP